MPAAVVKLVAMLLLFVQGLVAFAPGQVLCIPVQDCGTHEQGGSASCGHCDTDWLDGVGGEDDCKDHDHGPFAPVTHPDEECGCHLHLPVPDNEQPPSNSRGDNFELRSVSVPLVIAFILTWELEPVLVVVERFKTPDFSVSDQVLALKSTRLLI